MLQYFQEKQPWCWSLFKANVYSVDQQRQLKKKDTTCFIVGLSSIFQINFFSENPQIMSLATYFAIFWEGEDLEKPEMSALMRMGFLAKIVDNFLQKLLIRDVVKNNCTERFKTFTGT